MNTLLEALVRAGTSMQTEKGKIKLFAFADDTAVCAKRHTERIS